MNINLEEKLVKEFPDLFPRIKTHPTTQQQFYGCACGAGWFNLIYQFCNLVVSRQKSTGADSFKFLQIKEKFGSLRLYFDGGDDFIEGAAEMIERLSSGVCELTGKPGALYRKPSGWLQTLCPEEAENLGAALYKGLLEALPPKN